MGKKRNSNICDVLNKLTFGVKRRNVQELSFIKVFRAYHKNKSCIYFKC